jgi:type I restriction enzyme R subunit
VPPTLGHGLRARRGVPDSRYGRRQLRPTPRKQDGAERPDADADGLSAAPKWPGPGPRPVGLGQGSDGSSWWLSKVAIWKTNSCRGTPEEFPRGCENAVHNPIGSARVSLVFPLPVPTPATQAWAPVMLERDARNTLIDEQLRVAGWDVHDPRSVRLEAPVRLGVDDGADGFIDYVLLDRAGAPLAVIEAKRPRRDPLEGRRQAAEYADAIQAAHGREPLIFLANGEQTWIWERHLGPPRRIGRFLSRDDLETRLFQRDNALPLGDIVISDDIVDRPYQQEAVRSVLEELDAGRRRFLLVLATGTGKTRIAMAVVDALMRASRVRRALFLVDRRALAEQALDAAKQTLPSISRGRLEAGRVDMAARFVVATYPAMLQARDEFSPGHFDLLVCDESHRSIYNRYKSILDYFDCPQMGLTATPVDFIDRDTFSLFERPEGRPTFELGFDEAVRDGYVRPFEVYAARTRFQLSGIKAGELPGEIRQQLEREGATADELDFEGSDLERRVTNAGTDEAVVREFMEVCERDPTGTLPGKTIFFAMSHRHAMNLLRAFEQLYPAHKGVLAEVIDSHMERAERSLKAFKTESMPRVAISVDMLDTGVDVPEVVNLVFAKPVFSRAKFWQMIGRGSRRLPAKTRPWCREKDRFLILDLWGNFDFFEMTPQGRTPSSGEALPVRRFRAQLDLLEMLWVHEQAEVAARVARSMRTAIERLPDHSPEIDEAEQAVRLVRSDDFWSQLGPRAFAVLKNVAPVLRASLDVDESALRFGLACDRLGVAALRGDEKTFDALRDQVEADLRALPTSLRGVQERSQALANALSPSFWTELTVESSLWMEEQFGALMRFRRSEPRPLIELDLDDQVLERRWVEFGPDGQRSYANAYREQAAARIRELATTHRAFQRVLHAQPLSPTDRDSLAQQLNTPDLFITEQSLRDAFLAPEATLEDFVRAALDETRPEERVAQLRAAVNDFIRRHNLSGEAQRFAQTFLSVLEQEEQSSAPRGLTYDDLLEPPFARFGRNAVARLLTDEQTDQLLELSSPTKNAVA